MKSTNPANFEELIEKISLSTGLSDRDISLKAGRNAGYIAQLRSRFKSSGDLPPQKFIDTLRLRFANELGITIDNNSIKVTKANVGEEIGHLKEREIYLSASMSVLEQIVDKLVSDHTGKSIALVSGERRSATEMEVNRLFDEERKKHKQ